MPDDFSAKRESLLKYLVEERNAAVCKMGDEGVDGLDLARNVKELNELIDAVNAAKGKSDFSYDGAL